MALFGLISQPLCILHTTFKKLRVNFFLGKHKNNPLIRTKERCLTCIRGQIKQQRQKKVSGFKSAWLRQVKGSNWNPVGLTCSYMPPLFQIWREYEKILSLSVLIIMVLIVCLILLGLSASKPTMKEKRKENNTQVLTLDCFDTDITELPSENFVANVIHPCSRSL